MAKVLFRRRPVSAPSGVLWQLAESSTVVDGNGALLFGFDARWGTQTTPPTFDDYAMVLESTSGPSNQDVCRIDYGSPSFASQGYLGGMKTVTAPSFGGPSIFLGGLIRISYDDYPSGAQTCKHIIIGNNLPGNRPILVWGMHFGADPDYQLRLQIDGGVSLISGQRFGNNEWLKWEIEIYPGNASGDTNAYYSIWTGASTTVFLSTSPTATQGGLSWVDSERAQFGEAGIGFFHNGLVSTSEVLTVRMADYYLANTFQATNP